MNVARVFKFSSMATSVAAFLAISASAFATPVTGKYYLSNVGETINVVQGNSIIHSFATNSSNQWSLNVDGDIRTSTNCDGCGGGSKYTLGGAYTGVNYAYPAGVGNDADDGATDGVFSYTVSYDDGNVYRMGRDFSNAVALFNVGSSNLGITYDPTNNSLWISGWDNQTVRDFSMTGTLLSSFNTSHLSNGALALDYSDNTLWLANDELNGLLEQYSRSGILLGTGIEAGYSLGGEFDFASASHVPEPATLGLFGLGIFGFAAIRRRK